MPGTPAVTVAAALQNATSRGLDRLDAQLLLLDALGRTPRDRAWLIAHDTEALTDSVQTRFAVGVQRRAAGEPLAYITGYKAFYGLDLQVDGRVLVPRPDTETLVDWALDVLVDLPGAGVLDLGTGSGAIALALKATRGDLNVLALDFSPDALAVAQANACRLGLEVQFARSCWLDVVTGQFDVVVSNPPYIAHQDPHLAQLTYEPLQALASGLDGLDDIRQIVKQAPAHLKPGGWLLLEHGYNQALGVRQLLEAAGLQEVQSRCDLAGIERCSGARQPWHS